MEGTKDAGREEAQPTGPTPRQEEATSGETVADLEEAETGAAAGKGGASTGSSRTETSSPSPEGASDGARGGRADGSDTGGPM